MRVLRVHMHAHHTDVARFIECIAHSIVEAHGALRFCGQLAKSRKQYLCIIKKL